MNHNIRLELLEKFGDLEEAMVCCFERLWGRDDPNVQPLVLKTGW
jgi:hypothetical protein